MKILAATRQKFGPPEVLSVQAVDAPMPKSDEIQIEVKASTVNRTDCGFLRAKPAIVRLFAGLFKPRAKVLGCEFSGVVSAVGDQVDTFKVGDQVVGFDDSRFGGHGQLMCLKQSKMITKKPNNLSHEEAAAMLEGSHYALNYVKASAVKKGDYALVYGATGAVGSAAVQLLNAIGAHVTAVSDTDRVLMVKSLGAKQVIDYKKTKVSEIDGQYDLILDTVGKIGYSDWRRLLSPGGIYSSTELGKWGQNPILALFTRFSRKSKVIFPLPGNSPSDADYIANLAEKGQFKPVIDRAYDLKDIVAAYQYVERGHKTGNVIIKLPALDGSSGD